MQLESRVIISIYNFFRTKKSSIRKSLKIPDKIVKKNFYLKKLKKNKIYDSSSIRIAGIRKKL